jgi:hypothetical protein
MQSVIERLRIPFHWWSPTRRVLICALIVVLTFALVFGQVTTSREKRAYATAGQLAQGRPSQARSTDARIARGDDAQARLVHGQPARIELPERRPPQARGPAPDDRLQLAWIGMLAEHGGLAIERLAPSPPVTRSRGVQPSVSLVARGEFAAVVEWVRRIERLDGRASVEHMTLTRATEATEDARGGGRRIGGGGVGGRPLNPSGAHVMVVAEIALDARPPTDGAGAHDARISADTVMHSTAPHALASDPFDIGVWRTGRQVGRISGRTREVTLIVDRSFAADGASTTIEGASASMHDESALTGDALPETSPGPSS